MAKRVFISYRRSDDPFVAQFIALILLEALAKEFIFVDTERLTPGRSFDTQLMEMAATCDVLLAVIGPKWLDQLNRRRLHEDNDYVRREIATALRASKQVIPLLLGGAQLPSRSELPTDLASLPDMQGARLRTERFKSDLLDLCLTAEIFSKEELEKPSVRQSSALKAQSSFVAKFAHVSPILNGLTAGATTALATLLNAIGPSHDLDWDTYEYTVRDGPVSLTDTFPTGDLGSSSDRKDGSR